MTELATIAERVWKVCPECRPYGLNWNESRRWWDHDAAFFMGQSGEHVYLADGVAELLIIGACVKWLK